MPWILGILQARLKHGASCLRWGGLLTGERDGGGGGGLSFALFRFGFGDFFGFLFRFRFGGFVEFHGADEEAGEEAAAEESITEEFPSGWEATGSLGEGNHPAGEVSGVFRVMVGIEEPGGGVGEQVEQDGSEYASPEEFQPGVRGAEDPSEADHGDEAKESEPLVAVKGTYLVNERIEQQVGDEEEGDGQGPSELPWQEYAGAECEGVDATEARREQPGNAGQGQHYQEQHREPYAALFVHGGG